MKIKSFEGGYDKNLCYLIWCEETNDAAIIDPSVETCDIIKFISANKLILTKILITHTHHDHIRYLREFLDLYPHINIYASEHASTFNQDNFIRLSHSDTISIGKNSIISLFTPGHYKDSMCYWNNKLNMLFTGDTVFVGRTGRTVSRGSNISDLYDSIYNIILQLPIHTIIYPGHNYGSQKTISIEENIESSVFFRCKTLDGFISIMKNFENNRQN